MAKTKKSQATAQQSARKSAHNPTPKPTKKKAAPARGALAKLRGIQTGIITDALTRLGIGGWMQGVYPAREDARVFGPAATIRFGPRRGVDQLPMSFYEVIRGIEPGSVLVIEAQGTDTSVFGDNIATCGQVQGLAGMVSDARARDFSEIRSLDMPVFCQGPTIRLPIDIELVAHGVPITCGGAQVNPGDIVMGDGDGVVVIPGGAVRDVLFQAEDMAVVEGDLARAVRTGASVKAIAAILARKKILRK